MSFLAIIIIVDFMLRSDNKHSINYSTVSYSYMYTLPLERGIKRNLVELQPNKHRPCVKPRLLCHDCHNEHSTRRNW